EPRAIEDPPAAPRQPRADARREHSSEPARVDVFRAFEPQAADFDGPFLVARPRAEGEGDEKNGPALHGRGRINTIRAVSGSWSRLDDRRGMLQAVVDLRDVNARRIPSPMDTIRPMVTQSGLIRVSTPARHRDTTAPASSPK